MRQVCRAACLVAIGVLAQAQRPISPPSNETVALAVDQLLADRWYPATGESVVKNAQDEAILAAALRSTTIRQFAVRQLGRFEDVARAPAIAAFLDDKSAAVRQEAIQALVRALRFMKGPEVEAARQRIFALLSSSAPSKADYTDPTVIYEALGRLHHTTGAANEVERQLIEEIDVLPIMRPIGAVDRTGPALAGLEQLILQDPNRPILDRTRNALLKLATPLEPSRVALRILATLHLIDRDVAETAVRYRCPPPIDPIDQLTCGWEIRRSGVQLLDARDAKSDAAFEMALTDAASPVRIEALRKRAGVITETKRCKFLVDAFNSPFLIVRQEAVDLATPICDERDAITDRLKEMAVDYGDAERPLERAPLAAHALIALARFSPDDARADISKIGAGDADWNGLILVRQAGATAAGVLKDEAIARRFMDDPAPNVQTEALKSLNLLRSEARIAYALIAIESADYQLVRTAAGVLRNPADRHETSAALLKALARLTAEGKDTSREVRLEILDRLKEMIMADPGATNPVYVEAKTFEGYLKDCDPLIASAAADILGVMNNGKRPAPQPTRRPLEVEDKFVFRPSRALTLHLDVDAVITLSNPGDTLEVAFLPVEAPLTVTHFRRLVATRYYDNQKIYRVVPQSFFAAGSPQGNEFSGQARFLRNEIGLERHTLGAIGMLTHGLDTGNAQFFIDLGRHPEWDDDYTVIGRVLRCFKGFIEQPLVNCLGDVLEGTKVTRIDLIKP